MVQLTVEARTAYKAMIAALEEEAAEEGSEKCNSTHEESLPETSKAPHVESDDDVPNYSECLVPCFAFLFLNSSFPSL